MINPKKYLLISFIGLLGTAILGFFLFKNIKPSTSVFDILPSNFSSITYLKLNENTIKFLKTQKDLKNILSGINDITFWTFLSGGKEHNIIVISPNTNLNEKKLEKQIKSILKKTNFNSANQNIYIEKFKGKLLLGSKDDLNLFKKLPHNFRKTKFYKNLPKKFDGLVLVNFNNIQIQQFSLRNYSKNLDYLLAIVNISQNKISSNIKIFFKNNLNFKQAFINEKLLKLVNNQDYVDILIGNWLNVIGINKNLINSLYSNLIIQFPQLNLISKEEFTNLILNSLQNFEIKITDGNNFLGIGAIILFSGENLFNTVQKFIPFIKQYLATNLGTGFKLEVTNDQINIIYPGKLNFPFTKISLEKKENFSIIKILEPNFNLSNQSNEFVKFKNNLLFIYINIGKIINKLYTLTATAPYISEKIYNEFKNSSLIGSLKIYKNYIEFNFLLNKDAK